jgi:cytochrome P450
MPTVDLVLRETLRLVVNNTALRRHLPEGGGNMNIPGGVGKVPNGGFLAYNASDAHLNPNIYTDPGTFNPERFGPGREEDKREPYAFLGWGAGKLLLFVICPF